MFAVITPVQVWNGVSDRLSASPLPPLAHTVEPPEHASGCQLAPSLLARLYCRVLALESTSAPAGTTTAVRRVGEKLAAIGPAPALMDDIVRAAGAWLAFQ